MYLKMRFHVLGIFISVGFQIITVFAEEQDCLPRDGFYAKHHNCNRPCVADEDCVGDEGERCLCDGRCGLSCINLENTVGCKIPDQPNPPNTGVTSLNRIIQSMPVPFGRRASVQCWLGYRLEGDSAIICMANGNWSTTEHHCIGNTDETRSSETCGTDVLIDVANAETSAGDAVSAGDTVTYTCMSGYVPLGTKYYVTCLPDGIWSPIQMECTPATCGNPGIPEHGFISSYNFRVGSTVTFRCQKGYELIGDNSRTCSYDRKLPKANWSNTAPSCQPMSCSTLSVTSPLQALVPNTLIGTVARFECDGGYRLVGKTSITCLASREWSGDVPTCEKILCNVPTSSPDIVIKRATNLQILHSSMTIEVTGVIKYECRDVRKLLLGNEYRTCLKNSSFSGFEPSCHESCDELLPVANPDTYTVIYSTVIPGTTTAHGTVVLFYCREYGYFLRGANRFECFDGTWEPQSRHLLLDSANPYCIATEPSDARYFSYSIRTPLQYAIGKDNEYHLTAKIGSDVYIDCKRHLTAAYWNPVWVYLSNNPNTPTVILNSRMSKVNTFLVRNNDDPGWYRLILSGVTENDNGKYSCINIGSEETMSSVKIKIGNVECSDPGTPVNGARDPPAMPSMAPYFFTFSCNEGYKLIGSTKSKCSKSFNYEWTTPLPVCKKIEKTCYGKTFPGWNGGNGFSYKSYVTNAELDEATQSFYCNIGYTLEPPDSNTARCRNESEPQWDIEGTHISCIEKDRKVKLDPAPAANRKYTLYTETYLAIACHLIRIDPSYQIKWKVKNKMAELVDVSTDLSSRVHTITNSTWSWLIIKDSKFVNSGEYACVYQSTTGVSRVYKETVWLEINTVCPDPSPFPNGVITASSHGEYNLPDDVVTLSCDVGYTFHGITKRICLSNGTWEDFGPPVCIPDLNFAIHWGNRQLINKTNLQLTVGSDVILDCQTGGNFGELDPAGQLIGWFRIDNDGTRRPADAPGIRCDTVAAQDTKTGNTTLSQVDDWCQINRRPEDGPRVRYDTVAAQDTKTGNTTLSQVDDCRQINRRPADTPGIRHDDHFDQILMADGNKLRMLLRQTATEQAGTYGCGTLVGFTTVHLEIIVPCLSLGHPSHGSVNGWSWRKGTVVTYTCDQRYQISRGDLNRTCQLSGEWTGIEPVCSLAKCPDLLPPANGGFSASPAFDLNAEVTVICADDSEFEFGAKNVLRCQSNGTWNGTVPSCVHKCQNTVCGPGAKCVINPSNKDPKCICKDINEDCASNGQTKVCGSDAQTYDSQCAMEVYACNENGGIYPSKVADGTCVKRGLCSSKPVLSAEAQRCDLRNVYYYNPTLMKCTDTPTDYCMEEDTGFSTRETCDSYCTEVNYCNIARDSGPCDQNENRWYWDSSSSNSASHTCVEFTYGGCAGNENNFKTRDECLMTCPDRCVLCPDTMNLFNACDYGQYATRATILRLSRFEKTAQRKYPTTFHIKIKNVLKTNAAETTPGPQEDYALWSTVLYRGVTCPCPRFLPLDTDYLIISKLEDGLSRAYKKEPIVTEGTFVRLWSEDLECELRCTSTCSQLFQTLGLTSCPHPSNPKCSCCS
ncbi:sushi, von Willebrand factor type A, EGF and pentraxin domain-containing protein 1-like [Amphiura filiformis]|uniref:sushi, von Willebrand factor type A, EGF and pentraxin domain-containing protein 1-like n=1 Tax=Amphiura filiformis TaxID=82378 RepID=UPI003B226CD5